MRATLAPGVLLRGDGALAALGPHVARLGSHPLIVRGSFGFGAVGDALGASLAAAVASVTEARHEGPVTRRAIDRLARAVREGGHDVVVGVGGGRVLDAAKGAAHDSGRPFGAVPTSPATCAATTALCVLYDEAGAWAGPLPVSRCPDVVALDAAALAAAPDRLLAAGVLDALCKVEEVRLAPRAAEHPDVIRDAALALCTALASRVDDGALPGGLPRAAAERADLAEAVIVLPGLIAGLAGEGNKLAAAHAVHNALTLLPGHHAALHGELVAFGVLVQMALLGAPDESLRDRARWVRRLGVDASLAGVGSARYHDEPEAVLARMVTAPALRRAFPDVTPRALDGVIRRVDGVVTSC